MNDSRSLQVIAIDGGGTRCRIAFADAQSVVTVETGSANVSTDFDGAVLEITAGLSALAERANRPVAALSDLPAFIGLAGVTGKEIAKRLRGALPFARARIEDDRPAALRGALGHADGVIAHCGTGSFFAAQSGGRMRFAGGWGPVLGDEASAQWIGRTALRLTLESVDGRFDTTPLAQRLLSDFGGTSGIVSFAGTARPPEFGALAPLITDFAGRDDVLAKHAMQAGADEIARSLPDIGWKPGHAICLTGGLGPNYARYLPQRMQANLKAPAGEPLSGALSLAREFAEDVA